MKLYKLLIIIAIALLIGSCTKEDEYITTLRQIREICYDISMDFCMGNLYGILDRVHPEYLHKGRTTYHLNQELRERLSRFPLLDIQVLYIDLKGDYLTVYSLDTYTSSYEEIRNEEPETFGWMSYFKYHRGQWLIYGNQSWLMDK